MNGERYFLTTAQGRYPLPGAMRRSTLQNSAPTPNLQRGRNQTQIYDLSDGLPDPQPITLSGRVRYSSEGELMSELARLEDVVRSATAFDREGRNPEGIQGGALVAVPVSDYSGEAEITIALIPTSVRRYTAGAAYFG